MSAKYTNTSGVPLSIAVFLATDHYDHNDDPNTISATALIKPLRQLILSSRVPQNSGLADITQLMASRVGTAIHDGIERSWKLNYKQAMLDIGIPNSVVNRVLINPTETELAEWPDAIPVYMEQRLSKKVGKWTVSGKFDFIGDGRLEDYKSTGVFSAMNNSKDYSYKMQGSIYRWLDPKKITKDEMAIQFIFTDWSSMAARQNPAYPQQRFQQRIIPLQSITETDQYVRNRLHQIETLWDVEEDKLPLCSDEELWRSEPTFKYYKNGDPSSARSTKNFDNQQEAVIYMSVEGKGKGIVVTKPGQVTACKYCAAFSVCSQKDDLIKSGDLVL